MYLFRKIFFKKVKYSIKKRRENKNVHSPFGETYAENPEMIAIARRTALVIYPRYRKNEFAVRLA